MSQQTLSPMKSSMKGSRKQSFTVVKTLESSPKRKIFVSRPPDDADDMNTLTRSDLGNTSPKVRTSLILILFHSDHQITTHSSRMFTFYQMMCFRNLNDKKMGHSCHEVFWVILKSLKK